MEPADRLLVRALAAVLLLGAVQGGPRAADPIEVEADRAELDERRGTAVYLGDVRLRQGRVRATGARLTLHRGDDGRLERVVMEGQPATWRREPAAGEPALEGEARRILLYPGERRVVMEGAAVLRQGGSHFRSERIVYDLDRNVVRAGPGAGGQGRVRATILPRNGGGERP